MGQVFHNNATGCLCIGEGIGRDGLERRATESGNRPLTGTT
jgi:hypothetical protein